MRSRNVSEIGFPAELARHQPIKVLSICDDRTRASAPAFISFYVIEREREKSILEPYRAPLSRSFIQYPTRPLLPRLPVSSFSSFFPLLSSSTSSTNFPFQGPFYYTMAKENGRPESQTGQCNTTGSCRRTVSFSTKISIHQLKKKAGNE